MYLISSVVFKSNTSLVLCQSLNVCVCCPKQNQLVNICEKMQLQAQRMERFINQTLTAKERALQVSSPVTLTLSLMCLQFIQLWNRKPYTQISNGFHKNIFAVSPMPSAACPCR
jgi:hypothetical protein